MKDKYIFWDFDGTLAFRDGMWGGTLLEILEAEAPGLCATRDDLRSHLRSGFPWHTPEIPHPHIRDAKAWWHTLIPVFESAYSELGLSAERGTNQLSILQNCRNAAFRRSRWLCLGSDTEDCRQFEIPNMSGPQTHMASS